MNQSTTQPNLTELDHDLNAELANDFPDAKLRHGKPNDINRLADRPQPAGDRAGPPPPPVEPVAGAGAGAWGPSLPTPTMTAQLDCIHADAQRLIDTLTDMQAALAVVRSRL